MKEIVDLWLLVRSIAQIIGEGTSSEEATKRFIDKFNKKPSEDKEFFINANKV